MSERARLTDGREAFERGGDVVQLLRGGHVESHDAQVLALDGQRPAAGQRVRLLVDGVDLAQDQLSKRAKKNNKTRFHDVPTFVDSPWGGLG